MKVLNDLLWDGELKIFQDTEKFKFSIDSILLANFVILNKRVTRILDIGTGNAPIPLMLTKRIPAKIDGVEIQKESFELAEESVKYNNLDNQINLIYGDIKELYKLMENNSYDTIVSNPPYFKSNTKVPINEGKRLARNEQTLSIKDIFIIAKKLLKDGGNIAIVIDTERLVEVMELMRQCSIEPKRIQFVYPKNTKNSKIMLVEGTKNGNPGIKVLNPIYIQDEENNYTEYIENLLNNFGK
mgnify:CR=1 FL=1